jgi:hypothetical protein
MATRDGPGDLARRLSNRVRSGGGATPLKGSEPWRRETYALPREQARAKALEWFERWPKAAYMTEIEFWRELDDGCIEFTIRRLPTAD